MKQKTKKNDEETYVVPDIGIGGIDVLSLFNGTEGFLHPVKAAEGRSRQEPESGQHLVGSRVALN